MTKIGRPKPPTISPSPQNEVKKQVATNLRPIAPKPFEPSQATLSNQHINSGTVKGPSLQRNLFPRSIQGGQLGDMLKNVMRRMEQFIIRNWRTGPRRPPFRPPNMRPPIQLLYGAPIRPNPSPGLGPIDQQPPFRPPNINPRPPIQLLYGAPFERNPNGGDMKPPTRPPIQLLYGAPTPRK